MVFFQDILRALKRQCLLQLFNYISKFFYQRNTIQVKLYPAEFLWLEVVKDVSLFNEWKKSRNEDKE